MSSQLISSPIRAESGITVSEVVSRRQRREFLELPWQIYAGDSAWVPPLLLERKEFIDPRKHPFYQHGAATPFVAYRGGRPVGRILASDDPHFNAHQRDNAGCFGMFESIDEPEVAHALLDAAADWLARRGRTRILGPIDYSMNYSCGLLVDGFDKPPRVMMNHNPPYYLRLFESWGLAKAKDLFAWWFEPNKRINRWRPRVERAVARSGVTVRPFRRNDLPAEILRCRAIYNEAWKDNWGDVPMTLAEFQYLAKFLLHLAVPDLLLMAEVNGRAVGFSLTFPDFNEAARGVNGRLFPYGLPIGLLRFWRNLKSVKTARLLALGVIPEFRRQGVAELLILRTFDYATQQLGYNGAELSWTLEDNALINRTIEAVGGTRYKTYRIYERAIGATNGRPHW
ncbi:MAG TPA: GNAT family N-acetyltransferase [Pirellulales bacterium]|nr:GNAT family N-acetyltransferase [Pirellulales bacterium]